MVRGLKPSPKFSSELCCRLIDVEAAADFSMALIF